MKRQLDEPETYLTWDQAQPMLGNVSRVTAWRNAQKGLMPAPVSVSPGRKAWPLSAILAWQAVRSAEVKA